MNNLKFSTLRAANTLRLPHFLNAKGERAHLSRDGSDWSLNDWYTATSGELGELGNVLKKVRRGDLTLDEARASIGKEAADVVTYLDILMKQCGMDLGKEVASKFNEVSERVDVRIFIDGMENELHDGVSTIDFEL